MQESKFVEGMEMHDSRSYDMKGYGQDFIGLKLLDNRDYFLLCW